jgi:hypothetical protein
MNARFIRTKRNLAGLVVFIALSAMVVMLPTSQGTVHASPVPATWTPPSAIQT